MRAFFLLLFSTSLISSILAESPWALEFDPQYGLSVRYEDVPIIRRSTLAIVSPDWNPVLFHQAELEQEIEKLESNTGPAILVRCVNKFFSVEYQIEALSDREFR